MNFKSTKSTKYTLSFQRISSILIAKSKLGYVLSKTQILSGTPGSQIYTKGTDRINQGGGGGGGGRPRIFQKATFKKR